jgi:hypothetical protein
MRPHAAHACGRIPVNAPSSLRALVAALALLTGLAPLAVPQARAAGARSSVAIYVYGAKIGQKGDEGCHEFRGDCVLFESDKPVVLVNYTYDIQETSDSATIAIDLESASNGTRKALAELSKRHIGKRLAVVVGGNVINAPEVRNALDQPALQLMFGDSLSFETVKNALAGETAKQPPARAKGRPAKGKH